MATYRTYTYIAADWDTDKDAVDQLHKWNDGQKWSLSFKDAHDLTQSMDTSLCCTIKNSLKSRMDVSKIFILIVGPHTATVTKGGCQYCGSYNSYTKCCSRGYSVDYRSYVDFECDKAVGAGIQIVILYNYASVQRSKCPVSVKYVGTHIAMKYIGNDGKYYWNYNAVKNALEV